MQLPDDWLRRGVDVDVVWYRLIFDLPRRPDALWALYVPSLDMMPAAYVNGVQVGGSRDAARPIARYWNRPFYAPLPAGVPRAWTRAPRTVTAGITLRATAPAATRQAVSRAEERPPPR